MVTLWPERVRPSLDFLLLIVASLRGARVRHGRGRIDRRCRVALAALRRFGVRTRFRVAELPIDGAGAPGPEEIHRLIDELVSSEFGASLGLEPPPLRAALKSQLVRALRERLSYLSLIEARIHAAAWPGRHVVQLERHPADAALARFLRERGLEVRRMLDPKPSLKAALGPLKQILAGWLPGAPPAGTAEPGKAAIWVQYEAVLLTRSWSILYWRPHVRPEGFDIVCYADHDSMQISPEDAAMVKELGLRWIDCRRLNRLARLTLSDLARLARLALTMDRRKPWWQRSFALKYHALRLLWRRVFERYQVKLLLQHQESEWMPCAQAEALLEAGGVMLGSHWSSYPQYNLNTHPHPQHVYFVWGRFMREALARKDHGFRHVLPSGLTILPEAEAPRFPLKEGLRFVVALFDSGTGLEAHHSPSQLSAFYRAVLRLLEEHPDWGALLKAKYGALLPGKFGGGLAGLGALPGGRELAARAASLAEEGRFVFLDRKIAPATASLRADLTACFGVNTPGFVAGILGKPAIHWDCAGYRGHPIYSDPRQKILYRDLEAFARAAEAFASGDRSIGDFGPWRPYFDEFQDGRGPERVGGFIEGLMADLVAGGDPAGALDRQAAEYRRRHGVPKEFEADSGRWDSRGRAAAAREL